MSSDQRQQGPPKKRKLLQPERAITMAFVAWVRSEHPTLLFTGTCGGVFAHPAQKVRQRAEGYNRGVPDLLFFDPRGSYSGLAMEMKSPQYGRLSEQQLEWLVRLEKRGWKTCVPRSLVEAQQNLLEYLELTNRTHTACTDSEDKAWPLEAAPEQ